MSDSLRGAKAVRHDASDDWSVAGSKKVAITSRFRRVLFDSLRKSKMLLLNLKKEQVK